ncbi:DUF4411 family protein [Paracoccus ferrooxidans]|nr:DUF4411 family protein [Paracoccus ferrooxidans]
MGKSDRTVVKRELSKPSKQRANRKVPDVCSVCGVTWLNDFGFYRGVDFRIRRCAGEYLHPLHRIESPDFRPIP